MEAGTELAKVLWYYNLIPDVSEAEQKIVCPFHNDVNPSMRVDIQKGTWYCFGCQRHGYARQFVSLMEDKYHGMNDLASYKMYRKILRSKKVSDIKIPNRVKYHKSKPKGESYIEAYDYYHGLSKTDWNEISEDKDYMSVREYMKNRGYSPNTLNIVKAKLNYNNSYPIIFPILDNGKFKGWVCRTDKKDVEAKRKYLYNDGFRRVTTLCGDYGSKEYVIVVEGFMDRLRFIEAGIEVDNVVAVLGWKMSKEQEDKLKSRGVTNIISALDNDECGKKGTDYLKTIFKVTRFQYLKGIKDPGEMSVEQFKKCYRRTIKIYNKCKGEQSNGTVR